MGLRTSWGAGVFRLSPGIVQAARAQKHSLNGLFRGRCVCTGDGQGGEQSVEKSPRIGLGFPTASPSPRPSFLGRENAVQMSVPCTQAGLYPAALRASLCRGHAL